jgi:hypothetical protein
VVFTTAEKCTGKYTNKNVTSIITFNCDPNAKIDSDPDFVYATADCTYLFSWDHPAACVTAKMYVRCKEYTERSCM